MKNLTLTISLLVALSNLVLAQCLPPTAGAYLDVNNVSARMNLGGSSWWDLQSVAQYEVPKGSGKHSFYAGAFWIGGKDEFDVPHVAAMRFGQNGNDFWPGPITGNGNSTIEDCLANDRIYKLNKWEVAEFRVRYNQVGYVIPQDILQWPADGNPFALAQADAPYFDTNGDGIYNPLQGDYPGFAFDEPVDKDYHLLGDQCLWWIENDISGPHTESGGEPLGVEIKCMAYAFASCNALNDQTFYRYTVTNANGNNYHGTYIGLWTDTDVGFAEDDYVQCDVMRHLGFSYNGFGIDGTGGPQHYGEHPPAVGIGILEGPRANLNDGVDNDRDGIIDENGEHNMMSHFVYHNNAGGVQGDPNTGLDYYNLMRGVWLDGTPMCYGVTGYPYGSSGCDTAVEAQFMFPGNSDPLGYGTGGVPQPIWTEQTSGNPPLDRRFLVSSGPFDLISGEIETIHYSAMWARDTNEISNPYSSAEKLFLVKDYCQEKFENGFSDLDCCPPVAAFSYQTFNHFGFHFSSMEEGTSFYWDYGDGSTGIGQFPIVHNYDDYGTYEVCLTVENECGTDIYCETVTITPPPIGVRLKRIEGSGNMARTLEFKNGMHDTLFVTDANRIYHPIYEFNKGPVRIEVLDSTLIPNAEMFIGLDGVGENSGWKMYPQGGTDTVYSSSTITVGDEQLVPQWGLLVQVKQTDPWNGDCGFVLDCSIDQSSDPWLTWLHDTENSYSYSNWIRSGVLENTGWAGGSDYFGDPEECFENILDGTWAPYKLASHADSLASPTWSKFKSLNDIENTHSIDVVITADQSKWSRCPVLEIADNHVPSIGNQERFNLRLSPSVDKNGNPDASGTMGMSWFPGYAVDLETGERLNMAFGENSWLQADNGADMIWNPTSNTETQSGDPILAGGHYIYVFGHNGDEALDDVPLYDEGQFIYDRLSDNNFNPGDPAKRRVYKDAMWVSIPLLEEGHGLLESDVTIKLRVRKPYVDYLCLDNVVNETHPLYSFTSLELGTSIQEIVDVSNQVGVYPNPAVEFVSILNKSELKLNQAQVYTISGQLVLDKSLNILPKTEDRLSLGDLSAGTYFVILKGEEVALVKRLVVN